MAKANVKPEPKPDPDKRTPKEEAFCLNYHANKGNGTQAVLDAGYKMNRKAAAVESVRLLRKPSIKIRLAELAAEQEKRFEVKADDILRELTRIGYSDIRLLFKEDGSLKDPKDWPDEIAACVASVEVDELFEGRGKDRKQVGWTKKIKLWNKNSSLDTLAKHKHLVTNKVELGDETLEALIGGSFDPGAKKN